MESLYDYKRHAILYVDDEEKSLKYFSRAFSDTFRVVTAPNSAEGLRLLEQQPLDDIGIILSDQRMPGEKGVQFLEKSRRLRPRAIRILVTAYSDLDAAIDAVNTGAIYKYVTKPWDVPNLETTLKRGLEFYIVQRERDALLREKLWSLYNLVVTDRVLSLGVLAAGVGQRLDNTLAAVRAFLELVPDALHKEPLDLNQSRQANLWQDFYHRVENQIGELSSFLRLHAAPNSPGSISSGVGPRDAFDRAIKGVQTVGAPMSSFKNRISETFPSIETDATILDQLCRELVSTARLITTGTGLAPIEISARDVDEASGQVSFALSGDEMELPYDSIRTLFDPTAPLERENGKSIHLLACYFLAHHLGGQMSAVGARPTLQLTVTLPRVMRSQENPMGNAGEFLAGALTNDRLWDKLLPL